MTHRTSRRLGLILALAFSAALLITGSAFALPVNPPKIGMVCMPPTTPPATFNLLATSGTIHTPDGNTVFMWSYADSSGAFQYPGPVLCVTQGQIVTVNLTNALTGPTAEPVSIIFPGQDSAVTASGGSAGLLTNEAAASGGTASYSFTAGNPGTYLYQSGSDISKQVEMGLYGALVVRPSLGANYAYDASTQFDPSREYMLLLAEIDPDLHHAVETGGVYDFTKLHNHYYTINGRAFPDTIQDNGSALLPTQPYGALVRIQPNSSTNTQPALIRLLNAGADNHPFHPHGNHTREIAQDGRPIKITGSDASTEHFGETIGSGQTLDYLIRWDNQGTDTSNTLFNDNWDPVNNTLPPQPNYLNLTFKDGNTWYAGSPYLGYKGTLPVGTVSQNICGEWYFPFHSHALNEFSNFDEGFGGMGTLLRVDPAGGCFTAPASTAILGGVLKSGSVTALALNDSTYYQVNPKTTTRTGTTTFSGGTSSLPVASAVGFPTVNGYFIRVDNEVMQVTVGAGTLTWTILRGQLGTAAVGHATNATITALANDWYAGFTGVPAGASNLKVTYTGKNCGNTTGTSCTAIAAPIPQQTVKICNWVLAPTGCSTTASTGWVTLPGTWSGPADPQTVGSSDVTSTWTFAGLSNAYIGTGAYKGQVRILVHTQRWTSSNPTAFSTWGNFMQVVYDAP